MSVYRKIKRTQYDAWCRGTRTQIKLLHAWKMRGLSLLTKQNEMQHAHLTCVESMLVVSRLSMIYQWENALQTYHEGALRQYWTQASALMVSCLGQEDDIVKRTMPPQKGKFQKTQTGGKRVKTIKEKNALHPRVSQEKQEVLLDQSGSSANQHNT